MAVGKSKGIVVKTLVDQIQHLKVQNERCAEASKTGTGRAWMLGTHSSSDSDMAEGKIWNGDTLDLTGIKKAFDRSDLTSTFNDIMNIDSPGTGADRMAIKFQSDYLAAMDRALRTRHAGLVRCELFASERRHLQAIGNLEKNTITYAQSIIARGQ